MSNARNTRTILTATKAVELESNHLHGAPESKNGKPEERYYNHDIEQIERVLVYMGINVSITENRRLGKYEQNKTRNIVHKDICKQRNIS